MCRATWSGLQAAQHKFFLASFLSKSSLHAIASASGQCGLKLNEIAGAVRAAPSPLHGDGAFACSSLKAGSVATLYPVHVLGNEAGGQTYMGIAHQPSAYSLVLGHYSLGPDHNMWIDALPEQPHKEGWLGHLVNDAAVCEGSGVDALVRYFEASLANSNCVLMPFGPVPLMCVLVIKDIPPGGELLTTYGEQAWGVSNAAALMSHPRIAELRWQRALEMGDWQLQLEAGYREEMELFAHGPRHRSDLSEDARRAGALDPAWTPTPAECLPGAAGDAARAAAGLDTPSAQSEEWRWKH